MSDLSRLEALLDETALHHEIAALEASLPIGVRPRQLRLRTFLLGAACCLSDGRPAHLVRVHQALCALNEADRWRLGVFVERRGVAHLLTYRQVESSTTSLRERSRTTSPTGSPANVSSACSTR